VRLLTWNIQATKGCDGRFHIARIVERINSFGDLDVICLQEVARYIPELNNDDQPMLFAEAFAGYDAVWGPGFSVPVAGNKRIEFGNLTLVKSGLLKHSQVHSLPSPCIKLLQIPRTMVEVTIRMAGESIAVFNTHLAFHSTVERIAQLRELCAIRNRLLLKAAAPDVPRAWGPYLYGQKSGDVILAGDLNTDSNDEMFLETLANEKWIDCWGVQTQFNKVKPSHREPTCGCFDTVQWPEGPHVRDYFLATEGIAKRTRRVVVDVETDASDHQPVLLELD